jgi:hypothetical protein
MILASMRPRGTGIAWYRRADYRRILEIMTDREKLPVTFDKWQSQAEHAERQLKAQGHFIIRVHIDPEDFVAWCAANGLDIDAKGRMAFVNGEVYRQVRDMH